MQCHVISVLLLLGLGLGSHEAVTKSRDTVGKYGHFVGEEELRRIQRSNKQEQS